MPNTSRLALPYPSLTDPPNAPSQIQALASALDGLRSHGQVWLTSDFSSFTSDGFNVLTSFTAGISNGTTLPSTYRFTVPKSGTWFLTAQARLTRATASTTGAYTMQIRKNSADSIASGSTVAAAWGQGNIDTTLVTTMPLVLAAGDYVQMFVAGLIGSTLKGGNSYSTYMSLRCEHF